MKMNLILNIFYHILKILLLIQDQNMYETLMDDLSDKIQYLPEDKREKFTKFILNIIAHLSKCFIKNY